MSTSTFCQGIPVDICKIESPCIYWVRKVPVTKQEKESLLWIENFNKQCNKLYNSNLRHQLNLERNDIVAVLSKDSKRWDRGQVLSYYQTASMFVCKIFLIDRGQEVHVECNNLLPISETFSLKPRIAYQVGIFGILPKFEERDHSCQKECKCKPAEYVRYLLKNYAVQFDCVTNICDIAFGHVYLDCDHEGYINLADKLCEEGLAVRSTKFTEDILKYFLNTKSPLLLNHSSETTNLNESSSVGTNTDTSSQISEGAFSDDSCQSQGEVNGSSSVFMKAYERHHTQCLMPAGMLVKQTTKKDGITNRRISKMNGIFNRMRENNYAGKSSNKSRITNNYTNNLSKKEMQNAAKEKNDQKKESLISSKKLFSNQGESLPNMTGNALIKESTLNKNLNHTSVKTKPRILEVKQSKICQPNMSKFLEKIAEMKCTTENIKNEESKDVTDIVKMDSVQNTNILESMINSESNANTSVNFKHDNGVKDSGLNTEGKESTCVLEYKNMTLTNRAKYLTSVSIKNDEVENCCKNKKYNLNNLRDLCHSELCQNNEGKEGESKCKNKHLTLLEKLKILKSKDLGSVSDVNRTVSGQDHNSETIKNTNITGTNNLDNVEKESLKINVDINQPDEPDIDAAIRPTEYKLKFNKNLRFIDKVKNISSVNLKNFDTIHTQYDESLVELKPECSKYSEDEQKLKFEKAGTDSCPSELVKETFMPEEVKTSCMLNKQSASLDISMPMIGFKMSKSPLFNDSGLNDSLSEDCRSPQLTKILPVPQLNNSSTEDLANLSQSKSSNLLDKIKYLFKSNANANSDIEKMLSLNDPLNSDTFIQSAKLESVVENQLNKETVLIQNDVEKMANEKNVPKEGTFIHVEKLKSVEENQLNKELTLIQKDMATDEHKNDGSTKDINSMQDNKICIENDEQNLPKEKSKRLTLAERLKLLKQQINNISSVSECSLSTSISDSSLTVNTTSETCVDEQSFLSTSCQSDSHISFKSRKSFDPNHSTMTLDSTKDSDLSFENRNISKFQGYFDFVRNGSVLVHGNHVYKPVKTLYDAKCDEVIAKNFEKCGLRDLSRIQKYAIPIILDRQNIIMVSSHHTGKSLAYILPLLCLLRQANYYEKLQKGCGPRAVIIASGWKSAQKLFDMCNKLLKSTCDVNVQLAYVGGETLSMKVALTNGCDLLISTPRCFLRLLKDKYVTNIHRMCHLILDEVDTLFSTFMPEVQELMGLLKEMLTVRESSGINIPVQAIILSDKWTLPLEELTLKVLQNPMICIASHIEAAVYSRVKPVTVFLKPENKISKLFELLEIKVKQQKTVIVCAVQEEVEEITLAARFKNVEVISVHQGLAHIHCADLQKIWASKPASHESILVCTDDVLSELAVVDAQNLIHFSLPSTKTVFSFRFACLLNAYRNIFDPDDKKTCQVHIFMDENNDMQLPEITRIMQRFGINIPSYLTDTVTKILEQREMQKKDVAFCQNMKQFGCCWNKLKCKARHILKKEDGLCQTIPRSGQIKVTVLNVHNAGYYSVRLLEHNDGKEWIKLPQDYLEVVMEVNNYFNNEEIRRLHGFPNVGDIAGIETSLNSYHRVKVLNITAYDEKEYPLKVSVKLIDQGVITECQVMQLFMLPDKLKTFPAQAVDVYLCKMLPVDLDQTWNIAVNNKIALWIKQISEKHENSYFVGKIVLSLGMDIWLDPLECAEWLPLCNASIEYMSLSKRLLEENLAVDNPEHITILYKLCDEAGISYLHKKSEPSKQTCSSNNQVKPQWAHLPRDDYTNVTVAEIVSLDKIFLKIIGFQDRLQILSKDIETYIRGNNNQDSVPKGLLQVGDCCLGRFPDDGKWYRAMVLSKSDEELELFYVDHGDDAFVGWDDVKSIRQEFVTRLPFQVIECYLAGVEPLDGQNWEESAVDFLYNVTETNGIAKSIFVKVCDIDLKAKVTGGRRYKVILVDTTGSTRDTIINKELVLQGYARYKTDEKFLLDNIDVNENELDKEVIEPVNNVNGTDENENNYVSDNAIGYPGYNENLVLTKEENDRRLDEILLSLESNDFEYVTAAFEQDNYTHMRAPNANKISIKEVLDTDTDEVLKELEPNTSISGQVVLDTGVKDIKHGGTLKKCVPYRLVNRCEELSNDFPQLVNYGKCPNITWYQNNNYVWVRVHVTGIQENFYRLVWKIREIHFSTFHQDVFYCVNLDLYGAMDADYLHHSVSGFYIEIKLKKCVTGLLWSRLVQEKNKLPWIKASLDHYKEAENTCLGDEIIDNLKSFNPDQMFDNNDDDAASENSEVNEPDVVPYDPYDPFG